MKSLTHTIGNIFQPLLDLVGAVLANAVYDATGARLLELPMTPDRLKAALSASPRPA